MPLANCWPLVGLVSATLGGVLVGGGVVPPLQAVPFSVNAVGGLLVPVKRAVESGGKAAAAG